MSLVGKAGDAGGSAYSIFNNAESAAQGDLMGYVGLGADIIVVAQSLIPAAYPTPVIAAGLQSILAMNVMTGLGRAPERGHRFSQGAQQFSAVSNKLATAFPTQWEGTGAQAYGQRNAAQQKRADAMAQIDASVQQIVDGQADQVQSTRKVLNASAAGLGYAIPLAMAAYAKPIVGPAISMKIQLAAVAIALPPCGVAMTALSATSAANAAKLAQAINQYKQVASMSPADGPAPTDSPTSESPESQQPPSPEHIPDHSETAPVPPVTAPSGGGPAGGGAPSGGSPSGGSPGGGPAGGGAPGGGSPSGGGGSHSDAPQIPSVPSTPTGGGLGGGGTPGGGGMPGGGMPGGGGGMPGAGLGGLAGGLAGALAGVASQVAQTVSNQQAQEVSADEQEAAEQEAAKREATEQAADGEPGEPVHHQPVETAEAMVADERGERAPVHDTAASQIRPPTTYPL
ncbi:EspA/EspE family type VII secretion system effector [Mycolicibacterium thermoresistibile]